MRDAKHTRLHLSFESFPACPSDLIPTIFLTRFIQSFLPDKFNWRQIGTFIVGKVQILLSQLLLLLAFKSVQDDESRGKGSPTLRHLSSWPPIILLLQKLCVSLLLPLVSHSHPVSFPLFTQGHNPEFGESPLYPQPHSTYFPTFSQSQFWVIIGRRRIHLTKWQTGWAPCYDMTPDSGRETDDDVPYYYYTHSTAHFLPHILYNMTCPFYARRAPKRAILLYICFCQSLPNHNSAIQMLNQTDRHRASQTCMQT